MLQAQHLAELSWTIPVGAASFKTPKSSHELPKRLAAVTQLSSIAEGQKHPHVCSALVYENFYTMQWHSACHKQGHDVNIQLLALLTS